MSSKSLTILSLLLVNLSQSINVYGDRGYTLNLAQGDEVTLGADGYPSINGGSLVEPGNDNTPALATAMMKWSIITLWVAGITLAIMMLTGKNCYTSNDELFGKKKY